VSASGWKCLHHVKDRIFAFGRDHADLRRDLAFAERRDLCGIRESANVAFVRLSLSTSQVEGAIHIG
jgi:hypothetical protein